MLYRERRGKEYANRSHGGGTVLIVSHSTHTIVRNCTRAVWLEKGIQKMMGDPKEGCRAYIEYGKKRGGAG